MVLSMLHTGFVVSDLAESVTFYRDVVGLKVVAERERDGGPITEVVGYDNAHLKIALMQMDDGHVLELIQYVRPEGESRHTNERNAQGSTHLAFSVANIEETFELMLSRGAHKLNSPVEIGDGRKICYLQDPDGNWLELIESSG